MNIETLLTQLDSVRPRGSGRWAAKCPAHADRSPSLSIRKGERALLIHCWAGCTLEAVIGALGIRIGDLFYDSKAPRIAYRQRARREEERQRQEQHNERDGFTIDALREADYFTLSRQGLNIATWNNERLNDELDALADAYALLCAEELAQWT
jgi:hypothetical protein